MIGKEEFVEVMRHAEGRAEGRAEGQIETKNEIAEKLIKLGKFSLSEIADITETPLSDIKKLKNKQAN